MMAYLTGALDMKVILRSLGEFTGVSAAGSFIESLDLDEVWQGP